MGLFTPPEDLLISAMTSKQPQVRLEHCIGSIEGVFKNALKKERRLLAFLSSYEANYLKKGLVQLSYDYDVTIQYQEPSPSSINDVIVDNGDWDATTLLKKGVPQELTLITSDIGSISKKLTSIMDTLLSSYEGIHGWQTSSYSFDKLSTDTVCTISYAYIVPQQQLRQLEPGYRTDSYQFFHIGRQRAKPSLYHQRKLRHGAADEVHAQQKSGQHRLPGGPTGFESCAEPNGGHQRRLRLCYCAAGGWSLLQQRHHWRPDGRSQRGSRTASVTAGI